METCFVIRMKLKIDHNPFRGTIQDFQ